MRSKLLLPTWLLLCTCTSLQAGALNQCRGQAGTTAYRSGDCLPGERLVAVREIAPDPMPATAAGEAPRASPPRAAKRAHATRRGPARARAVGPKRRKPVIDPCTREQRARDAFQRRRGIHVTMDELSRWNHRVYDACK